LPSHPHAGFRIDHAGASVWLIVDHASALEAVADAAQDALRVTSLINPERPDAVRQKGGGDALADARFDLPVLESEKDGSLVRGVAEVASTTL